MFKKKKKKERKVLSPFSPNIYLNVQQHFIEHSQTQKSEIGRPYVAAGLFHILMNENQ